MLDEFSSQTEKFLHRWAPSKELIAPMPQPREQTPEQTEKRLEVFMQKVESQSREELAKRKASRSYWLLSQLVSARLQYPAAVTALIISICVVLFMTVARYNRRELREAVGVSFPTDETLKQAEQTIELLRNSTRQLETSPDPARVANLNALVRNDVKEMEPSTEQLPATVRAQLAEMAVAYNGSLAQWKVMNGGRRVQQSFVPIAPIQTGDSAKLDAIYKAVEKDSPANADILKNATIARIDEDSKLGKGRWEWVTATDPQVWDDASFRQAANATDTILRIRDQRGYLREFAPSQAFLAYPK
jgi:hypothetical protein